MLRCGCSSLFQEVLIQSYSVLCNILHDPVLSKDHILGIHTVEIHFGLPYQLSDTIASPEVRFRKVVRFPVATANLWLHVQVLFIGMASLRTDWGVLQHEVCQALALQCMTQRPNSSAILQLVWPKSRNTIMRAMLALYEQDTANLERILDVCLDIGALGTVLDSTPLPFAIDLASTAAGHGRGVVNLEKWLQDQVAYHNLPFLAVRIAMRCLD